MKKFLIIVLVLFALIAGGIWYLLGNAGNLIKQQIEEQGSKYLGTNVSVLNVELALQEGRLTINDFGVDNPANFSQSEAFSFESITLDIGDITSEPYTVQTVSINAPEILYEVDASGSGNLLALKEQLMKNLPSGEVAVEEESAGTNPLVIVENVVVSNARLKLNFEQFSTGELDLGEKAYEVELPTFSAGSIGKPNGLPADQVGAVIAQEMLDNVIAQAKQAAKDRLEEEAKAKAKEELERAKEKANEKLEEEKKKLQDKAAEKLKGLFNN